MENAFTVQEDIYCSGHCLNPTSIFFLFSSDVSYTKTKRTASSIISLPIHLTLVGCYGSEEKLIDCAHHEYGTSYSTDISISCGRSSSGDSAEAKMATASLAIATICAFAMIVLVTVLIIILILFKRKKHVKRWVKYIMYCLWLLVVCPHNAGGCSSEYLGVRLSSPCACMPLGCESRIFWIPNSTENDNFYSSLCKKMTCLSHHLP